MASTGMATVKTTTIFRDVRTRAMLLFSMRAADLDGDRWLAGAKFQPRDCRPLAIGKSVWFCDGDDTMADGADCGEFIEQYPFNIEDALRDTTLGLSGEELLDLLRRRHDEMISWAFGSTLVGKNAEFDGLTLPSTAHAPDSGYGAGTAAVKALAILENELADTLHSAQGLIHVSPGMLLTLNAGGALEIEAAEVRTPSGHIVVADPGYYRAAQPTGESASTANTSEWIYASGPIEYKMTPFNPIGDRPNDYTDPFNNAVERMTQSHGIFLFDPCAVTAVLATY